jgi:NAD(P)-dependent dehydrogenase (short-subunit alcohol dehydrogenase family)
MTSPSVLITGALTGIGRATAFAFADTGARLVISGRRDDAGQALAQELRDKGIEAEFVRADVRHEDEVRQLVDAAVACFGRLDVAVNNAGTEGVIGPFIEQTPETYAATFDTNVLGVFLCMKYELRAMLAQGRGSIVNISSAAGKRGTAGLVLYAASKHAVEGLTKSVALEVAGSGMPWPRGRSIPTCLRVMPGTGHGRKALLKPCRAGGWAARKKSPPRSCSPRSAMPTS